MSVDPKLGTKPRMLAFRRRHRAPTLSRERAKRQGEITNLAFSLLGSRDRTIAFLNCPDAALGGRPLDLAIASSEGYTIVEQEIGRLAASSPGDGQ